MEGGRRGTVMAAWVIVVILLAASLLVGIQTSQAKRWVFGSGFTVEEVAVSGSGDFFVTSSRPDLARMAADGVHLERGSGAVLHYFIGRDIYWNATVSGDISSLAMAGSGSLVAAGLTTGGVQLYTGKGDDLGSIPTQGPVTDIALSDDGGIVAVVTPADRNLARPGGLMVYRLGVPTPLMHLAKPDLVAVETSADGSLVLAGASGLAAAQVLMFERTDTGYQSKMVQSLPGSLRELGLANDGRHGILVTDQAAFLLARDHNRPVGMVPDPAAPPDTYQGGGIAPDGQSYLLLHDDRTAVSLHKWGEKTPRWTATYAGGYQGMHLDSDGARAALVETGGDVQVLSVTTGRPIKALDLDGGARSMTLSQDGRVVVASDDTGRLYRAPSGYGGLLGVLPDPIVSTLYANPTALLWLVVLCALAVVASPMARPALASLGPQMAPMARRLRLPVPAQAEPDTEPDLPDHADADTAAALAGWKASRLDGPVTARGLCVERGGVRVLSGVDLVAQPGALTAIVGGSGEGKSTLLRALLGQDISAGTVRLGPHDPSRDRDRVRRIVGYVPQDLQLYLGLTPLENLLAIGGQFRPRDARLERDAARLLRLVGLDPEADRSLDTCSGGERRRASIATALLHRPAVLVLDEPTTGLDPLTRRRLWRLLADLRDRLGVTIIVSTHYLEEAERADTVLVVEGGAGLACGSPGSIVASAPGGPHLWGYQIDAVPIVRPANATLEDHIRGALAPLGPTLRELRLLGDELRLRLSDDAAANDVRGRLAALGIHAGPPTMVPMRFEDAFVAHLAEARRAADRTDRPSVAAA